MHWLPVSQLNVPKVSPRGIVWFGLNTTRPLSTVLKKTSQWQITERPLCAGHFPGGDGGPLLLRREVAGVVFNSHAQAVGDV